MRLEIYLEWQQISSKIKAKTRKRHFNFSLNEEYLNIINLLDLWLIQERSTPNCVCSKFCIKKYKIFAYLWKFFLFKELSVVAFRICSRICCGNCISLWVFTMITQKAICNVTYTFSSYRFKPKRVHLLKNTFSRIS